MKYLVMVQCTQADYEGMRGRASRYAPAWSEQELQAMYAYMGTLNEELAGTGELVDGQGLAEPARARLVTVGKDGGAAITDDPYEETEAVIAGYWVLDCASPERVTQIAERAARCPGPEGLTTYPVVIRPIQDGAGDM